MNPFDQIYCLLIILFFLDKPKKSGVEVLRHIYQNCKKCRQNAGVTQQNDVTQLESVQNGTVKSAFPDGRKKSGHHHNKVKRLINSQNDQPQGESGDIGASYIIDGLDAKVRSSIMRKDGGGIEDSHVDDDEHQNEVS